MNNPYYLDMDVDYTNKRKYKEIESLLKRSISHKKFKFSKKRSNDIQDIFYVFSRVKH